MRSDFRKKIVAFSLFAVMMCGVALAQDGGNASELGAPPAPVSQSAIEKSQRSIASPVVQPTKPWLVDPETMPSLFFSTWTQALIAEARFSFQTRPPTEAEIQAAQDAVDQEDEKDPGVREVSLGGIVFADAGDWTIWLNGQRVLPEAIPPEILDLKVHRYFIELKWFDAHTNQVFPIRLRPHQRFNLDTRIFLPG